VFIVGDARSGTTLLYRSLQHHASFAPSHGFNLAESHAMRLLMRLFGPGDVTKNALAHFMLSLEPLAEVAADIAPLARRRKIVRRIFSRGKLPRPAFWRSAGEHHVVRRYFLEAHRRRGATRLVEKTPTHTNWVPHLKIAFPKASFIFMTRHPLDVLSSYWKRYRNEGEMSSWANVKPDEFSARWERVTRRALTFAKTEGRFLLVRYEELTADPEPTLRKILDHVGEPFDDACLLRGDNEDKIKPGVKAVLLRGDPHMLSSVIENTKRWDEYVDRATAEAVERRLRETMTLVGYEPRTNPVTATTSD
jgi:hypothetical protein